MKRNPKRKPTRTTKATGMQLVEEMFRQFPLQETTWALCKCGQPSRGGRRCAACIADEMMQRGAIAFHVGRILYHCKELPALAARIVAAIDGDDSRKKA
jgi:hypothetical protein